jgi:hypothetical protein
MPLSRITGNSFNATANTNIDNGLLFLNPTTNRIGVNTITPQQALHVDGILQGNLVQAVAATYPILQMKNDALASNAFFRLAYDTDKNLVFQSVNNEYTAATEFMRMHSTGGLSIGTTTSLATLTVRGNICPSEVPSTNWGIDFAPSTSAGAYVSLANNATYDLATGSGIVWVYENAGNGVAQMYAFFGSVSVTNITAGLFSGVKDTAGKVNFYYESGTGKYRFQNKTGATSNIYISTIRLRAST